MSGPDQTVILVHNKNSLNNLVPCDDAFDGKFGFKRRYSYRVNRINANVLCNHTSVLTTHYGSKDCPTTLRRVLVNIDLPVDRHCEETFASCASSLYEILQVLSLSMLEIIFINQLFTQSSTNSDADSEPNKLASL